MYCQSWRYHPILVTQPNFYTWNLNFHPRNGKTKHSQYVVPFGGSWWVKIVPTQGACADGTHIWIVKCPPVLYSLSHVQLFCDPTDCSLPGSSSLGFPRWECWSGLPFYPPEDLLDPGIKPAFPGRSNLHFQAFPAPPVLQAKFLLQSS